MHEESGLFLTVPFNRYSEVNLKQIKVSITYTYFSEPISKLLYGTTELITRRNLITTNKPPQKSKKNYPFLFSMKYWFLGLPVLRKMSMTNFLQYHLKENLYWHVMFHANVPGINLSLHSQRHLTNQTILTLNY